MKAKKVSESQNFERGKDPKESMGIGINDIHGYVDLRLKEINEDSEDFWESYLNYLGERNDKSELVEIIMGILEHTPLEYQMDFIKEDIDLYIEQRK